MTASSPGRGQVARRALCGLAVVMAVASGCALGTGEPTAYCQPDDPLVTPQRVAPGDDLRVEVPSSSGGTGCEHDLPDRARYEVLITVRGPASDPATSRYSASLGTLEPGDGGAADGTFPVPDDVPSGEAQVSVSLRHAPTVCEVDPTIGCAAPPSALVDVAP
ncbi:hypothetical protein ACF049_05605 [Cellulosimicrobium funkei]|uniref:hypothetical protein n=1 Tax=Cellulosimicrobium TaxID=157920 RepID=UPI0020CEA143|nr:hypothetical protein NMQ07_00615 [Cellulosimicrobium cellulans]